MKEAENSPYNVFCFRIPAVVQTDSGVLLAFAEARIDTCADCAELGIAMRRSEDGGELKRHFFCFNKFEPLQFSLLSRNQVRVPNILL